MKVIMKQIEMIALFSSEGLTPIKFKLMDGGEQVTIKIDRVIDRSLDKWAGNHMLVFICESSIDNISKRYELKYELGTCKWYLARM